MPANLSNAFPVRLFTILATVLVSMFFGALPLNAQIDPNLDNGIHAFGSYDSTDMDSISLTNGALSVSIPLFSLPQRGGLQLSVSLRLGSKRFVVMDNCDTVTDTCKASWQPAPPAPGSGYNFGMYLAVDTGLPQSLGNGRRNSSTEQYYWTATDPDGATHQLEQISSTVARSVDGSGILCTYCVENASTSSPAGGAIFLPNGTHTDGTTTEDSNGNYMNTSDSLNRLNSFGTSTNAPDYEGCGGSLPNASAKIVTFPGPYGSARQVKLCYGSIDLLTDFQATSYDVYGNADLVKEYARTGDAVLQSASLYDGNSWTTSPQWTFTYNNGANGSGVVNYADLTQITFPAGGTVSYGWGTTDIQCGQSLTPMSRRVGSRTINAEDGSPIQTFTFGGTVSPNLVSVIQGANEIDHTFDFLSGGCNEYEVQTDYYSGSGSSRILLKSVHTTYQSKLSNVDFTGNGEKFNVDVLPTMITTTLPGNLVSKIEKDYDPGFSTPLDGSISYGNVTQMREYDFGSGSPGALIRCTSYSYKAFAASSYLGANLLRLPSEVITYAGACNSPSKMSDVTYGYDESGLQSSGIATQRDTAVGATRGNLTSVQKWLNTGGNVTTYSTYYDTGMTYQAIDANNNTTTYSYSPQYVGAYVTQTTMPTTAGVQHIVSGTYDLNTGLLTGYIDQNKHQRTYSYDDLARIISAQYPDGGTTQVSYPDYATTEVKHQINASQWTDTITKFDGLGRVKQTQLVSDPSGTVYQDTAYDAQGNVYSKSNPYRSSSDSSYITRYVYDGLHRVIRQTNPDQSYLQWCFDGTASDSNEQKNCTANLSSQTARAWTDYSDETARHWQRVSDGLGRLTAVMEPGSTPTPSWETDYQYDVLDNLIRVDQWGGTPSASGSTADRIRTFIYDSLSRLTNACNPESITDGATCTATGPTAGLWSDTYTYYPNGNLQTRKDSRVGLDGTGITTTYNYDALNRITQKTYTNTPAAQATPAVYYYYDLAQNGWGWGSLANPETNVVGRLAAVSTTSPYAWIVYGYDEMGRTTLKSECLPGDCGYNHDDLRYRYDLSGDMTFYDRGTDFGRNNSNPNQGFYYGGFNMSYDGGGHISGVTADSPDANHPAWILMNAVYTPFGELYQGRQLAVLPMTRSYDIRGRYTGMGVVDSAGNPVWNTTTGYSSNGSVKSYSDTYNGSWSYLYGNSNRLAQVIGPSFTLAYTYDNWGNRTSQTVTAGSQTPPTWTAQHYNANNHLTTTWIHDAAGNVTFDGRHSYTYDAENRISSMDGYSYIYDGENNRVATLINGSVQTRFLYDFQGRLMTELDTNFKAKRANIYVGNELFAEDAPDPYLPNFPTATLLRITDQVGTLRAREDVGANWVGAVSSLPYGDDMVQTVQPSDMVFTGKERDTESDLDYFGARYYNATRGRFMSPDPAGLLAQNPANPQSWNLYAYALNNPLSNLDPDGLDCVYANDAGKGVESIDHNSNSGECGSNGGSWVPGYAAESWAHFNKTTGLFQVGSINVPGSGNSDNATVDYTTFAAGAQTQWNGDESSCTGGCSGFASANANWLQGQLVGGSLGEMMSFMANRTTAIHSIIPGVPTGMGEQILSGPLDFWNDRWAGPGGMGVPSGKGDWAAMAHDFNYNTNGITIGSYFNPFVSRATAKALIQSNNNLIRNAGGFQSVKMGLFFGTVNVFQWAAHAF